jgi:hypothetical protein
VIPKPVQEHFREVLEYLSARPTLDSRDLEFLDAFGREMQRCVERIRARGPSTVGGERG